jgi:ubiquinone/menaquinone biosynthesis C-methylase UbiE
MTWIVRRFGSPEATRTFFNRAGSLYGWITRNPLWRSSLREMSRHFPPSAAQLTVLDIGCGPGNSTLQLLAHRPDLHIVGLDFASGILRLARAASVKARILDRTAWIQANGCHLPVADNSVDAITGHSIFYMLGKPEAFLAEAMRVLRPGGRLILLDPLAQRYPLRALAHVRMPRAAISVLLWHGVSRMYPRLTLEYMSETLISTGFARVLAERVVEGWGVLSRGEKPYPDLSTVERIALIASTDVAVQDLQIVDSAALPEFGRGRFVFLLIRQTPDKPPWAIQSGDVIRWDAAMVTDKAANNRPLLLAFTSLPKAVAFMQPAVTSGLFKGININKVGKFDKAITPHWATDVLLNPPFEMFQTPDRFAFEVTLPVDPASSVIGEE